MSVITQPHDNFIKTMLADPEKTAVLLREQLPKAISERLSSDLPELMEGSFVDEELREHLSDRLFRVKTISGRVALLYCLVEHKSFPTRRTAWQLHRYMMRALEQWELRKSKVEVPPGNCAFCPVSRQAKMADSEGIFSTG